MSLGGRNRLGGLNQTRFYKPKSDSHIYNGKDKREHKTRKAVDYNALISYYLNNLPFRSNYWEYPAIHPNPAFVKYMLPPSEMLGLEASNIAGKCIKLATNKDPEPTFSLTWTLNGRRLFTGNCKGQITLWNGLEFNFVTIITTQQKSAIRAMVWTHSGDWLIVGSDAGTISYFEPNMNPAQTLDKAHGGSIRSLSIASTDRKFVSGSDDQTIKLRDLLRPEEPERIFQARSEVRSVEWNPYNSLVVAGTKSHMLQLWDMKSKSDRPIRSLQNHKEAVIKALWNQNGNWFVSISSDHSVRLYDIRTMNELQVFKSHSDPVSAVAWHPFAEKLLTTADKKGYIYYWQVGNDKPIGHVLQVQSNRNYDPSIWDMKWHPFGHTLATCSNDCSTWFWARNRPGDKMDHQYNLQSEIEDELKFSSYYGIQREPTPQEKYSKYVVAAAGSMKNEIEIPGLGPLS